MLVNYSISDIIDYINWTYFFHAWGFPQKFSGISQIHGCDACQRSWVNCFDSSERLRAEEALALYHEACHRLSTMHNNVSIRCSIKLFPCYSDEDDIVLIVGDKEFRLPMLRSLRPDKEGYCLSLADFIHERGSVYDRIGVFATSVSVVPPPVSASGSISLHVDTAISGDGYEALLVQTLSDRLAEAAAEKLHETVRKEIWGYAPDESLSIKDLHLEKFQGIRPAVGYPSLPDISVNFLLDELLDFSSIGISLTDNGMMIPHASVSGLMLSEASAHYFDIGEITDEQLEDYARRRGMKKEEIKRFLNEK